MDVDDKVVSDSSNKIPHILSNMFNQGTVSRGESPSRRGKLQFPPSGIRDDLEELYDDVDDDEDEEEDCDDGNNEDAEEMDQEVSPIDDPDDSSAPSPGQFHKWSADYGEVIPDRKSSRKRPAMDELPDEVREELLCMGGTEVETRIRQRPKLEPPDVGKEISRGRKSPIDEDVADISQILSRPAKTPEERLAVLEARDKLIRNRTSQQQNTGLKNVGKCPDMCPEKERYQRIARHQVEYYEYNRDTKEVNHALMVKIYARSSADQQMPLPHDLRPVNVLWMTMSYLVNQFMDLADNHGENLGEWYHFLWDRMRSIRKDITQLALCDPLSVQILEMCARFHIFCMERLREEKMAVFDEKINRENLTKCLQSLQYMYNDLSIKNISCPNEPEFQAYSILLHINSDLCPSIIVGLRPEIRKHPRVQLAINAFVAVTMKNYARFFKLVKRTSYLNACILHQYFAQVRAHAMHSIIRAYSRQKMRNTYPLSELQVQLLFDCRTDVLEFCQFSNVPVEKDNIVLEKNVSHPIPMQEKMKRSFAGVEEKRQSSIKDLITGGCQLADSSDYHNVHDSFDEQGILKPEAWYAEDQDSSVVPEISPNSLYAPSKQTSFGSANTSGFSEFVSSSMSASQKSVSSLNLFTSGPRHSFIQTQKCSTSALAKDVLSTKSSIKDFSFAPVKSATGSMKPKISETNPPGNTSLSGSSSVSTLPFGGQKSEAPNKQFVFKLTESKAEFKEGTQSFQVKSLIQPQPTHSIFGGSAVPESSPEVSKIEQSTAKSTAFDFWSSQTPSLVVSQASENQVQFPESSNSKVTSSGASSAPIFSGAFTVSVTVSETFTSGNLWGSKPTMQSTTQRSVFPTVPTSVVNFPPAGGSAFNEFPSSVYGLRTQELASKNTEMPSSISDSEVLTDEMPSFPKISQKGDEISHKSPLSPTRDVTVPTSIFGFDSRPLTTPQMFPSSSTTSSTTVPPQIVASASLTIPGSSLSPKSTSKFGGFVFTLPSTTSAVPVSSSSTSGHTSKEVDIIKSKETSSCSETEQYSDSDILHSESEEASDLSDTEESENEKEEESSDVSIKINTPKLKPTLTRNMSKSQLSPVLKKMPLSPKLLDKTLSKERELKVKQLVAEIAHRWRLVTYRAKIKHRVEMQEMNAPLGGQLSLEEQVDMFPIPRGCMAVDIQSRLNCLLNLEDLISIRHLLPNIGKIKLEDVISSTLPSALSENNRLETNMFWKLVISLPSEDEGKKYSLQLSSWIDETFSDDSSKKSNGLLRVSSIQMGGKYNLFSCVQKEIGTFMMNPQGSNGLLFFTPRYVKDTEKVLARFKQIIKAQTFNCVLPVVVVVGNTAWTDICQKWCEEEVMNQNIAAYKLIGPLHYDKAFVSNELKNSILWLSKTIIPAVCLERWALKEVLVTLMVDLWTRVRYSLASRCSSGTQQHPQDIINLYHNALNILTCMVSNDLLSCYGDIPCELDDLAKQTLGDTYKSRMLLKSDEYVQLIKECFSAVKFDIKVPPEDQLNVESFCEAVCVYNNRLRFPISHYMCQRNDEEAVDWTEVVEALTEIHIRDIISELKLQDLDVIFEKTSLVEFCTRPWYTKWLKDRLIDHELSKKTQPKEDISSSLTKEDEKNEDSKSYEAVDKDEKLMEEFESVLNNLEEEFNIMELNSKHKSSIDKLLSPNSLDLYKNKDELDIFELQLDKYAKLFSK